MIIEFFGAPGSGKSFYSSLVSSKANINLKYKAMSKMAELEIYTSLIPRIMLKSHKLNKIFRIYDSISYEIASRDKKLRDKLLPFYFAVASMYNYVDFDKSIFSLILRSLERDLVFSIYCKDMKQSFINDDGILQRLISIFAMRDVDWTTESSKLFISTIFSYISQDFRLILFEGQFEDFNCKIESRNKLRDLELQDDIKIMYNRTLEFIDFLANELEKNNISLQRIKRIDEIDENLSLIIKHIKR